MKHTLVRTVALTAILGIMASPLTALAATQPSVSIYGFRDYAYVSSSSLKVWVPHNSKEWVHLWLNGKYQKGNGSYALKLRNGKNTVSAQVIDRYDGAKSRVERKYVTWDTSRPTVSISGIQPTVTVKYQKITVTSTHAQTIQLWLNGKNQSGNDGAFSVTLTAGRNVLTAKAINKHDGKTAMVHTYVSYEPSPFYTAYDFYGKSLGTYTRFRTAEGALASYPLGTVKDASGTVVYTEAGYAAFQDPAHVLGVYPSLDEASAEAGSAGYVVGANNVVDQQPSNYYSLDNGAWVSSEDGAQGSETPPASDIKTGIRYLPVTVNPGHSPYDTEYYPLEQNKNGQWTYIGTASDSFTWENSYRTVKLTLPSGQPASGINIDNYIQQAKPSSPLYGLGYSFMDAEQFGSNAVYLFSHAAEESDWGTSAIAEAKNNLFGYGAYNDNPGTDAAAFPTDDYAIQFESWFVRQSYLTPGASHYTSLGATLDGMSEGGYATDPDWSAAIAGLINNYADHGSDYDYSIPNDTAVIPPTMDPNSPNGNGEPVYLANDFQAKVPTLPSGDSLTYAPNVYSDYVKTLQNALNAEGCGPIDVDGYFGKATLAAVQKYQQQAGLPVTGSVDQTTWDALFPAIPGLTNVSEIYMSSTTNNLATAEVLTNTYQRVLEPFIHFTNVYRVEPAKEAVGSQAKITVYTGDSTTTPVLTDAYGQVSLHAGDYVSNDNGGKADVNGMVQVNFTQWRNGSPTLFTGYVPASALQMQMDAADQYTLPTYNGLDPSNE